MTRGDPLSSVSIHQRKVREQRHSKFLELMKMKRSEEYPVDMKITKECGIPEDKQRVSRMKWSAVAKLLTSQDEDWEVTLDFANWQSLMTLSKNSFRRLEVKFLIGMIKSKREWENCACAGQIQPIFMPRLSMSQSLSKSRFSSPDEKLRSKLKKLQWKEVEAEFGLWCRNAWIQIADLSLPSPLQPWESHWKSPSLFFIYKMRWYIS